MRPEGLGRHTSAAEFIRHKVKNSSGVSTVGLHVSLFSHVCLSYYPSSTFVFPCFPRVSETLNQHSIFKHYIYCCPICRIGLGPTLSWRDRLRSHQTAITTLICRHPIPNTEAYTLIGFCLAITTTGALLRACSRIFVNK